VREAYSVGGIFWTKNTQNLSRSSGFFPVDYIVIVDQYLRQNCGMPKKTPA